MFYFTPSLPVCCSKLSIRCRRLHFKTDCLTHVCERTHTHRKIRKQDIQGVNHQNKMHLLKTLLTPLTTSAANHSARAGTHTHTHTNTHTHTHTHTQAIYWTSPKTVGGTCIVARCSYLYSGCNVFLLASCSCTVMSAGPGGRNTHIPLSQSRMLLWFYTGPRCPTGVGQLNTWAEHTDFTHREGILNKPCKTVL